MEKLLAYRFCRFWLYVLFLHGLNGRKIESAETAAIVKRLTEKVVEAAYWHDLLELDA